MNHELIIGKDIEGVTQSIIDNSCAFSSNKVVKLNEALLYNILKFLPPSLQKLNSLYGLRLILQKKESMAHSGWLYSRYREACKKMNIDSKRVIAIYKDKFFREFGQFDAMERELFFLGFGQPGKKMLGVILKAESQFNPDDFDLDGYMN